MSKVILVPKKKLVVKPKISVTPSVPNVPNNNRPDNPVTTHLLPRRIDIGEGAWVLIFTVNSSSCQELLTLPFKQLEVNMFGKTYFPKRTAVTMGEPYFYNGCREEPLPLDPKVKVVMDEVNLVLGTDYNTCVANHYPDGDANIGMHDDGEQPTHTVAAVSFGDTRIFQVHHKKNGKKLRFDLNDHECLVMCGPNFQKEWKHGINKQKSKTGRIKFNFPIILKQ